MLCRLVINTLRQLIKVFVRIDGAMKNLVNFWLGLALTVVASFAASANEILRVGDATITYQSGYIDPENMNGNARDVTITSDEGVVVNFDRYRFKTKSENGFTRIKNFDVKGVVMSESDEVLTIQQFKWKDLVLPVADFNFNALIFDDNFLNQIEDFGQFSIINLDFFEAGQQNLHIDLIAFDSEMVNVPSLPDIPVQNVEIIMQNMAIAVDASQDQGFRDMMRSLNLDQFVINLNSSSIVDVQSDRVNNNVSTTVEFEGMGQIELDIDIGMLNSSLQILNAAVNQSNAEISDELVGLMFTGGMFNAMSLMIEDQGLLDLFMVEYANELGISKADAVNMLMDQLAITMGSYAPLTFAAIAPEVRGFLENGGELTVALNPPSPTVFSSFLGFAAVPDTAADALGLMVDHQVP